MSRQVQHDCKADDVAAGKISYNQKKTRSIYLKMHDSPFANWRNVRPSFECVVARSSSCKRMKESCKACLMPISKGFGVLNDVTCQDLPGL